MAYRRATKYCSKWCSDVAYGNRRAEPLPERVCALPGCTVVFTPIRESTRCCSEVHGKKLWRIEAAERGYQDPSRAWNDTKRNAYHRRRALKAGSATGEKVDFAAILERERWKCHLCGKRISKTAKWPDPMSPSQDHVVPLSRGGAHEPANVLPAHLTCNVRKNAGGGGEQLALIG